MPIYTYKARDQQGKIIEETIQASSREDAAGLIKGDNLQVLTIRSLEGRFSGFFSSRISVSEKASFCRFMGTMLRAGLSLPEAVEIIKQESENPKLKKILAEIVSQTRKGRSLSSVLAKYKEAFDPVFLTLVKAGEESGTLEQTFDHLAKELLNSYELSQKVKSALMYPIVVIGAMFGVGVLMLVFVLPRISSVFLKMNIELPALTKTVLTFGLFVGSHVALVLASLGATVAVVVFLAVSHKTRATMMMVLARMPAVNRIMNQLDVSRFSRTLAVLLKSGVPIVDALNVASGTLSQGALRLKAKRFGADVARGESLSSVLVKHTKVFPATMIQTIKAGEKTGSLDEVLFDLASFYEKEVEFSLKRFIALLEPMLMLVIGIVVGAMVIVVIAPIYSIIGGLQSTIRR